MTQEEHVLDELEKITPLRTEQHEGEKHTGIRTEKKKKIRKQGKNQENCTKLPVSATEPSRGPWLTNDTRSAIFSLLPTAVQYILLVVYLVPGTK